MSEAKLGEVSEEALIEQHRLAIEALAGGADLEALSMFRRALRLSETLHGKESPHTASLRLSVAHLCERVGQTAEAIGYLEAAVGDGSEEPGNYSDANALGTLANLYKGEGRIHESNEMQRSAEELCSAKLRTEQKLDPGSLPNSSDGAAGKIVGRCFAVGDSVEVRPKNVDELYYGATVLGVGLTEAGEQTYRVRYDDGTEEHGLSSGSIMPNARRSVFESEELSIVEGHIVLREGGPVRRARLMSFVRSPQLVQTAVVLAEGEGGDHLGSSPFDLSVLPFDINQAMAFGVPLLLGLRGEASPEFRSMNTTPTAEQKAREDDGTLRACVLGCGGGVVPVSLLACYPRLTFDVVELSEEVVAAARGFFGLQEDGHRLRVTVGDAEEFVCSTAEMKPGSVQLMLVDVADESATVESDAGDDDNNRALEIPPPLFVSEDFVSGPLLRCIADPGVMAINVLGGRDALLGVLDVLEKTFGVGCVYVLCTDPNYCFFALRCSAPRHDADPQKISPSRLLEWTDCCPERTTLSPTVAMQVRNSERYQKRGILLGWYAGDDFRRTVLLSDLV